MLSRHLCSPLIRARAATLQVGPGSQAIVRKYHQTRIFLNPYKDDQDRNSLKPRASDQTKSASDGDVAAHEDAAFNPKKTRPEEEKDAAGKKTDSNPLEVSGANQDISKPQGDNPGGRLKPGQDKQRRSGGKTK